MLTSGLVTTDTPYHAVTRFQPNLLTTMFSYTSNVLILFKSNLIICHLSFGFLAKKQLLMGTPNRLSRSSYKCQKRSKVSVQKQTLQRRDCRRKAYTHRCVRNYTHVLLSLCPHMGHVAGIGRCPVQGLCRFRLRLSLRFCTSENTVQWVRANIGRKVLGDIMPAGNFTRFKTATAENQV